MKVSFCSDYTAPFGGCDEIHGSAGTGVDEEDFVSIREVLSSVYTSKILLVKNDVNENITQQRIRSYFNGTHRFGEYFTKWF